MYLNKKQQDEMIAIMHEYLQITNFGETKSFKSDRLMDKFFINYADLIINGVIYAYKYWQYAELDDLIQEARTALIISIHKNQWDEKKGNVFNFFTTVIRRNLINFTRKNNHSKTESETDIDELYENENAQFYQNYDKKFIMMDLFSELKKYFEGKRKFVELTCLLENYYYINFGKKFVKKQFIEYAKAHNYSPAITNTFFSYLKRIVHNKDQEIVNLIDIEG